MRGALCHPKRVNGTTTASLTITSARLSEREKQVPRPRHLDTQVEGHS